MTEPEWNSCTDPLAMVGFLRGSPTGEDAVTWWNSRWRFEGADKGDDRRFRLFACACCRRIWDRIPEACNRDAVAAVEEFLDGRLPAQALEEALIASSAVEYKVDGSGKRSEPGYWAVKYLGRGFYKLTAVESALVVASRALSLADEGYGREAERATQATLLRCLFGNPFRGRPLIDPGWLVWNDGLIPRLAQAAYDDRKLPEGTLDNGRLAVLADALEEAGATDQEVLGHLRRPDGVHVRGCWVLDLLLRKE